jgi:RNA polymerase sigma-70 factor (ECF subfamily)
MDQVEVPVFAEQGNTVPEDDLLTRACRLETDALSEIHDCYYSDIFRFIIFRVSEQKTAEDLTSEVFIRLLDALHGMSPPRELKGWLYGVASHIVNDFYRKHYRSPQIELPDTLVDDTPGPVEMLDSLLTHDNLAALVAELTGEQQMVLTLRFSQSLSIEETARMMGKTIGSVKMLQARALARLATRLNKQEE